MNQNVNLVLIGHATFPLTVVIFDGLWPKGLIKYISFSLPTHRAVGNLKKKISKCLGPCEGEAG